MRGKEQYAGSRVKNGFTLSGLFLSLALLSSSSNNDPVKVKEYLEARNHDSQVCKITVEFELMNCASIISTELHVVSQ